MSIRQRISVVEYFGPTRRLFFLTVPVLLALSLSSSTGNASVPQIALEICRAEVTPCQREVSIPQNGAVDLDLVLNAGAAPSSTSPVQIVGWESHLRLGDTTVAKLMSGRPSGRPVKEQGEATMALEGLVPLTGGAGPGNGQYFTVQNQYDPLSGLLDYAVTLVRFDPSKPKPHVPPITGGPRWHLGRIAVQGSAQGTSDISVASVPGTNPSQVLTLNSTNQLHALSLQSSPGATAVINVGNVTTPELLGQVGSAPADDGAPTLPFPLVLTVSFWKAGAIPEWRGGNDLPVATFRKVTTDSQGAFQVTDIAPTLLAPGVYDLRVKGRRTLSSIAAGVTVPVAGAVPSISPVTLGALREGDLDGNNIVDDADLLELESSFGTLETQAGFNTDTDFNGDKVVDVLDFSRLAQNYGERGE